MELATQGLWSSLGIPIILIFLGFLPVAFGIKFISTKLLGRLGAISHSILMLAIVIGTGTLYFIICSIVFIETISSGERLDRGEAGGAGLILMFIAIPFYLLVLIFWFYLLFKARAERQKLLKHSLA
jgi:hypothetical protein